MIKPLQLISNKLNEVKVILKNNGKDTVLIGDTIYFRTIVNHSLLLSNWQFYTILHIMAPGDTIHHSFNLPHLTIERDHYSIFTIQSACQNRPSLNLEGDTTRENNLAHKRIWFLLRERNIVVNTSFNSMFQVFPNPASDFINIKSNKSIKEIRIYDNLGKLVHCSIVNNTSEEIQIDFSQNQKGIYFIHLIDINENLNYLKFVKN
ncbi:MAG: T9SS type A sorting domain-containing protein [Bacteroidota bacterium]|nr:T9SS type A sorting domain-containing protein [Bacteroidota bacterium]